MRTIRLNRLDARPTDAVFRQSPVPPFLLMLVGLPILAFSYVIFSERAFSCISDFFGVLTLVGGLMWIWIFFDSWRATRRETNWLLRVGQSGQIAVKFRSHLNWRFSEEEPQVFLLERADVLCVRQGDRRVTTRSNDGSMRVRHVDLEFVLREPLPADALATLSAERSHAGVGRDFSKSRYQHEAVQAIGDTVLRLAWRSSKDQVRPSVEKALEALRPFVAVGPPATGQEDFSPAALAELSAAEQDARLRQLAVSDSMLATETVKLLYNCSTKEAVEQVERWRSEPPVQG